VRARLKRKSEPRQGRPQLTDDTTGAPAGLHFFSPPDIEARVTAQQDRRQRDRDVLPASRSIWTTAFPPRTPKKRAEIKSKITDWRALIDYWAVDWDYNGDYFRNDWQAFRTRKNKDIATQAAHTYPDKGANPDRRVAVKVTDIFGNDGLKVVQMTA
jgi:hypothetical protein